MYLSIVILPLLGSIVSGFFGRKVGSQGSQIITSLGVILTTIIALILFFEVGFNGISVSINLSRWLDSEFFNIFWDFGFDALTVLWVIISLTWYNFAVLAKIQLYQNFINRSFISQSHNNSNIHLYLKTKNRNLASFLNKKKDGVSQIRNFSTINTGKDAPHFLSEEKLGGSPDKENFLQWFVGFSDAESNFIINLLLKKDKVTISNFSFMFKISLHKDDESVLRYIQSKLGIGNVRIYKNECIFNVTDMEGISQLVSIFDKYNLNTTKYLDYLDFKEAFNLYNNRDKNLTAEMVKDQVLELKNKMNTNRVNFDRPENSEIRITQSWLLGLIEGDGSFFVRRDNLIPTFSIELTGVQLPVMLKIKEFLENNLGFDSYSLYKLKNSSIIAVTSNKARNNSKASVSLIIKNVRVLNNYFVPFLEDMEFLTKKGKDFIDFKIICRAVYDGAYRRDEIKSLILKLSHTMNNFRLSTHPGPVKSLSKDERDKLTSAAPTVEHLRDGRQRDIVTQKVIHQQTSCVYEVCEPSGEILMVETLSEAATAVGVYPDTLSRHLDVKVLDSEGHFVELKNHKVRRVPVFCRL